MAFAYTKPRYSIQKVSDIDVLCFSLFLWLPLVTIHRFIVFIRLNKSFKSSKTSGTFSSGMNHSVLFVINYFCADIIQLYIRYPSAAVCFISLKLFRCYSIIQYNFSTDNFLFFLYLYKTICCKKKGHLRKNFLIKTKFSS